MPGIRNHKGSSAMLITYLRDKCMASEEYYDNFFSHDMCHITPAEVIQRLDNNHRRLKRKDDKFYRIFICPSQEELADLIRQVTGQQVTEFVLFNKFKKGKDKGSGGYSLVRKNR